eukprot:scaffold347816_cov33-Prasinocladus_malaysianus.AAC.1
MEVEKDPPSRPAPKRSLSTKADSNVEPKKTKRFSDLPLCGVNVTVRQLVPAAGVLVLGASEPKSYF